MGGTGGCCSLVQAEQPGTRHLGRWDVKRKPVSSAKSRWWQYLTTASLQAQSHQQQQRSCGEEGENHPLEAPWHPLWWGHLTLALGHPTHPVEEQEVVVEEGAHESRLQHLLSWGCSSSGKL